MPTELTRWSEVGQLLKEYREVSGKSQREVAEAAGISRVTLAKYEEGHVTKLDELATIARVLGVSPKIGFIGFDAQHLEEMKKQGKPPKKIERIERGYAEATAAGLQMENLKRRLAEMAIFSAMENEQYKHLATKQKFSKEGIAALAYIERLKPELRMEVLSELVAHASFDEAPRYPEEK